MSSATDIVPFDEIAHADLFIDRVYGGGQGSSIANDALARLLPVGNQGGFRINGQRSNPRLVVLFTTGSIPEWPDELDQATGVFTYYGDNKHAGRGLHDTARGGNQVLFDAFSRRHSGAEARKQLPVFLVLESAGHRDVRFRGLAVPGVTGLADDDELIAIWRSEAGIRFQNYRAKFTILSENKIERRWINDILAGRPYSDAAPTTWRKWVDSGRYTPLQAPTLTPVRTKEEQLPSAADQLGWQLLNGLYQTFDSHPHEFEHAAAGIAEMAVSLPIRLEVTRATRDGGRDALGAFRLGHASDPVWLNLALEAKCYLPGQTAVGVADTSRLISRLKYRDLGFMVTTSYVAKQAYSELREDGHPVVILSGGDIVNLLRQHGVNSTDSLDSWLSLVRTHNSRQSHF